MPTTFDTRSPEVGWAPFLAWLRDHDVNPDDCRQIVVADTVMVVELYMRHPSGRRLFELVRGRPELTTVHEHRWLTSSPPRRHIGTAAVTLGADLSAFKQALERVGEAARRVGPWGRPSCP